MAEILSAAVFLTAGVAAGLWWRAWQWIVAATPPMDCAFSRPFHIRRNTVDVLTAPGAVPQW